MQPRTSYQWSRPRRATLVARHAVVALVVVSAAAATDGRSRSAFGAEPVAGRSRGIVIAADRIAADRIAAERGEDRFADRAPPENLYEISSQVEPATLQPLDSPSAADETLPPLEPVPPITLTPLSQLTTNVAPPAGEMPHNWAEDTRRDPTVLIGDPSEPIRTAAPFYSTPRTPDFVNRPLYFEQRATERDGRSWGGFQPFVSAGQFFGTIAILPYKMGAQPPAMRLNTGNGIVVPSDRYTLKQHLRGAAAQTGVVLGLALP